VLFQLFLSVLVYVTAVVFTQFQLFLKTLITVNFISVIVSVNLLMPKIDKTEQCAIRQEIITTFIVKKYYN